MSDLPDFGEGDIIWQSIKSNTKKLKHNQTSNTQSPHKGKNPWELNNGIAALSLHALGKTRDQNLNYRRKEKATGDLSMMDGKNAERLRKGKLPIDGSLDLHGFTVNQAWAALKRFILFSFNRRRRCVIVVTGKGWMSKDGIGVLRTHLPKWLNSPELSPYILGFSYAQNKDGGDGAFYVMIKKNRK